MKTTTFAISDVGHVSIPAGRNDLRDMTVYSELGAFGRRDRYTKIIVTIPRRMLKKADDKLFLANWAQYGEWFSEEVARRVVPNWRKRAYGIIPGNYYYDGDGSFHFIAEPKPYERQSDSLLFYADCPMKGYAGPKGATTFRFGNSEFYGIILPVGSIFTNRSIPEVRNMIENGLKDILLIS